jgi:release factor glutamine methyltransferase
MDLYLQFDKPLKRDELSAFKVLFRRRLNHEPLQYICGETEFMSLRFCVDSSVLIPRPETEILVGECIRICQTSFRGSGSIRVLDVGTGSGNIAISLARFVENVKCVAIDVSESALDVARKNSAFHNIGNRISFVEFDIFDELGDGFQRNFNIVISNPPYVPPSEFIMLSKEIRDFEPREAILADEDSLRFFRRIAELGHDLLSGGGHILFEIGYDQAYIVAEMLVKSGYNNIVFKKDYSGIDRVVMGKRP